MVSTSNFVVCFCFFVMLLFFRMLFCVLRFVYAKEILPLLHTFISSSSSSSSFNRHNSYIQECTGHMEPTYHAAIHDLRLLLQRFAYERSFSEDTGGGGRESNMKFVPYAIHMIIYVLNT